MATKDSDRYEVDPDDGLTREIVGRWCQEKHLRLRHYVDITHATRRQYTANSPAYIDLYCGTGRARIRDTEEVVDGSSIVAVSEASKRNNFSQVHIADQNTRNLDVCRQRLEFIKSPDLRTYKGDAIDTAKEVVKNLNPWGLHLAFLDPYSLGALPFEVIQELGKLKRMDLIMHISEMDLQRNIIGKNEVHKLDAFAPGWRMSVDISQPQPVVKNQVLQHWKGLFSALDYTVSDNIERVRGGKNQPLYWLVFASRHNKADEFWKHISNVSPQGRLDF